MKRLIAVSILLLSVAVSAQEPTKLFDVRAANGVVDGANTYAQATLIVYRDAKAKSDMIDAFCDAYGYQASSGTKQAFFNAQLREFLRGTYKAQKVAAARKASEATAASLADADLP